MLEYTDDLLAVVDAFARGELAPEDLHIQLAARVESLPEALARRLLNDLELAVYTLSEPRRRARIAKIFREAAALVAADTAGPS